MKETATLTIGTNRGKLRLWLDGKRLANAGFTGGTLYLCRATPGRIEMTTEAHGTLALTDSDKARGWHVRKITGRPDGKPIADINGKTVEEAFASGGRVLVTFTPGRVVVTQAED